MGVCLVLGLLTRGAAFVSGLLFVAFIIGIASVWARGITIDCGCFGGGGYDPDAASKYPWEIARDVGLLALSAYLVWQGRTRLALDNLLFPQRSDPDTDADPDLQLDPASATTTTTQESDDMSTKPLSNKEKQRLRAERAAAALKEKQRRERRRQILTAVGVVVAIALIVGAGFVINSMRDDTTETASRSRRPAASTASPSGRRRHRTRWSSTRTSSARSAGSSRRPATSSWRSWPTRARCRSSTARSCSSTGSVPTRRARPWSGRWCSSRTARTSRMKFHDLLFANQPSEEGPFPSNEDLVALAGQAGADVDKLTAAVDAGDGDDWPDDATKLAFSLGVRSTPTVVLDGKPFTDDRTA